MAKHTTRPKRYVTVSVALAPDIVTAVDALAAASQMNRSEVLRILIERGLDDLSSGTKKGTSPCNT